VSVSTWDAPRRLAWLAAIIIHPDSGKSLAAVKLAGILADHYNSKTGRCDPDLHLLTTRTALSLDGFKKARLLLRRTGFLEYDSKAGTDNHGRPLPVNYRLLLPAGCENPRTAPTGTEATGTSAPTNHASPGTVAADQSCLTGHDCPDQSCLTGHDCPDQSCLTRHGNRASPGTAIVPHQARCIEEQGSEQGTEHLLDPIPPLPPQGRELRAADDDSQAQDSDQAAGTGTGTEAGHPLPVSAAAAAAATARPADPPPLDLTPPGQPPAEGAAADARELSEGKGRKAKAQRPPWEPPPWLNLEAWREFEQHRRELRKPLTDRARDLNAKLLRELTQEQQQACIEASIAAGWTGLFPDRITGKGPQGRPETARDAKRRELAEEVRRGIEAARDESIQGEFIEGQFTRN